MKQRSSSLFTLFFLPVLAFGILALAYAALQVLSLPDRTVQKFGPPAGQDKPGYWTAVQLALVENDLLSPANPAGTPVDFKVDLGESATSVTQRLEAQGVVRSARALRLYLQYSGLDTTLQAGEYTLSPELNAVEIAHELQDPTPTLVTFTVLAGWRVEEIGAALSYTGLDISPKALESAARTPPSGYPFTQSIPSIATAEGFLFPGMYELPRELTAPELLAVFLGRFEAEVPEALRQGIEAQGLSLFEGVTLASIVEREAVVDTEMTLIAAVFYNRLRAGMTLASDPTVQYALGYNEKQNTWWTNPLSLEDLGFESLYNTYIYAGLPPGPIANPGLEALWAVAQPAETAYYYFRALCDGSGLHVFAETFDEHISNACK